jgi:predicted nucleic acid-binding protein
VALIVLDASLVIAHLTLADALHEGTLGYLEEHAADDLRLPASAYAEVLVGPARTARIDTTRQLLDEIAVAIEPLTRDIAERAASLRAEHRSLRLPDALVLATGDVLDADEVATADRRWRRFDRVRVLT